MFDLSQMQILDHESFWAKDPAPGTVYFELGGAAMELVGREIDPELDDPDNAVMIQVGTKRDGAEPELYAVLRWGDWNTPENQRILELRENARKLMEEEIDG